MEGEGPIAINEPIMAPVLPPTNRIGEVTVDSTEWGWLAQGFA